MADKRTVTSRNLLGLIEILQEKVDVLDNIGKDKATVNIMKEQIKTLKEQVDTMEDKRKKAQARCLEYQRTSEKYKEYSKAYSKKHYQENKEKMFGRSYKTKVQMVTEFLDAVEVDVKVDEVIAREIIANIRDIFSVPAGDSKKNKGT